ncbi:HAD domain-containing protein [Paenibacillus piri]|uniref:FCP1 homology domain-containing protein n=1 Tax=Paenibacillus piri TaxID=2547395 RepID=A0A4V2ZUG0_9BACL|nr:HAD domain-containing protein [Paenibacillus piri]TDG00875.1 hypothetical protein E1757_04495 [Paenibacillus piri]
MRNFSLLLDFDGVLATKFSTQSSPFDPDCTENLKSIIKWLKTRFDEVKVVVISNWRFDRTDSQIIDLLYDHGDLQAHEITILDRSFRKKEGIVEYIKLHELKSGEFVILDDDFLGEDLAVHQIRTRSEDGIRDLDTLEGFIP